MKWPWHVVLFDMVLWFLAISSGWQVFYVLSYALGILILVGWLWTFPSLQQLRCQRTGIPGRAQVGDVLDEELMLTNLGRLLQPWVEIGDHSTVPGHDVSYVARLGAGQSISWHAQSHCRQHGRFRLGPLTASAGDPFGLFRREIVLVAARDLVVLPRVVPLRRLPFIAGASSSSRRAIPGLLGMTTDIASIRAYVQGDPRSRIHARSTARYGKPMVKAPDTRSRPDVWIVLDLDRRVQVGAGEQSTEAYSVTLAATIASYGLKHGYGVGVLVNDQQGSRLPVDDSPGQLERILELLAVATPTAGTALSQTIERVAPSFGRNAIIMVITPSPPATWHTTLNRLQICGMEILVVALIGASFAEGLAEPDPFAVASGMRIPVIQAKCGETIVEILERDIEPFSHNRSYS